MVIEGMGRNSGPGLVCDEHFEVGHSPNGVFSTSIFLENIPTWAAIPTGPAVEILPEHSKHVLTDSKFQGAGSEGVRYD